jgi:hypothetical protein
MSNLAEQLITAGFLPEAQLKCDAAKYVSRGPVKVTLQL